MRGISHLAGTGLPPPHTLATSLHLLLSLPFNPETPPPLPVMPDSLIFLLLSTLSMTGEHLSLEWTWSLSLSSEVIRPVDVWIRLIRRPAHLPLVDSVICYEENRIHFQVNFLGPVKYLSQLNWMHQSYFNFRNYPLRMTLFRNCSQVSHTLTYGPTLKNT